MRRACLAAVLAAMMIVASAGAASAGEWNRGHFDGIGGDLPAKYHANSECLFNGLDQPDDMEQDLDFPDDDQWGSTPAGAHSPVVKVQTGGQLVAAGYVPAGLQGVACNGHLNPYK